MPNGNTPTTKVQAGSAGAIVLIFTWIMTRFAGIDIPADVASAMTLLVSAAAAYIMPTPEKEMQVIKVEAEEREFESENDGQGTTPAN